MMADTTTPDGYLVAADGSWVQEKQVLGGYVRTPYDNAPYWYREDVSSYAFDENTDEIWNCNVLAAVRGIHPVSELTERDQQVCQKVNEFLVGFPYGASEYDKARRVYNYLQSGAVYGYSDATNLRDTAYGALVKGEANCVGFAQAYKLLANAVGLRCGIWSNSSHMWNEVYIEGEWKSIDASSIGTSAEFFLDMSDITCPNCGCVMTFGKSELERPCRECGQQVKNPNLDIDL